MTGEPLADGLPLDLRDEIYRLEAEIERLKVEGADRTKKIESLWALSDARGDEIERLTAENARLKEIEIKYDQLISGAFI